MICNRSIQNNLRRRCLKNDLKFMRQSLSLARRGYGVTSPNPTVGAVLVKGGKIIGRGWHRRAGEPHAEIDLRHGPLGDLKAADDAIFSGDYRSARA